MSIKYKIIKLDESNGQIIVRPEGLDLICIDLPINSEGYIPEGEELNFYIQGFMPHYLIERKEKLAKGIKNIDSIKALVEPEPEEEKGDEQEDSKQGTELSEDEKLLIVIDERNKRLRSSDWVELPSVRKMHTAEWANNWDEYRQALRDLMQNPIDLDAPIYPIPPEE